MKFRDFFSLKAFLYALLLLAVTIPLAIRQSNNTVKIRLNEDHVYVKSAKYTMTIPYDIIDSVELASLPEAGQEVNEDSFDDDILRCGEWTNAAFGHYYVCADLDVKNCIVAHLYDGRIFVFNRKNTAETENIYQQILVKLPA